MKKRLKELAARMPMQWQQELKRRYFAGQINRHTFRTNEPEYDLLPSMVSPGDWALDVGANIGHYSARLSELLGNSGRVICFEPVLETFELLAANIAQAGRTNITLINAAASQSTGLSRMAIPKYEGSRLDNFYEARILEGKDSDGFDVLCLAIDSLELPNPVRLIKIDAEGHEMSVLEGMRRLLKRDKPILIVEDTDPDVITMLEALGYKAEKIEGSSNCIFRAVEAA